MVNPADLIREPSWRHLTSLPAQLDQRMAIDLPEHLRIVRVTFQGRNAKDGYNRSVLRLWRVACDVTSNRLLKNDLSRAATQP